MTQDWTEGLQQQLTDRQVDLDHVIRQIVDEITSALDADRGTLYLVDRARKELISRIAHLPEIAEIRLHIGEGVAGRVVEEQKVVRADEGSEALAVSRRIEAVTGYHTESLLAAPVFDPDQNVVAVIQVLNKKGGLFDQGDERKIRRLAHSVAEVLFASSLRSQIMPAVPRPLSFRFNNIVGESPPMRELYDRTARAARTSATVLIRGASGSGKELFARAVHDNSMRQDGPFVKVDCAALPENLIENELFGHERGAYTGADRAAEGKLDAAKGGTLFLDEIGELPGSVQGKLLRLLEDHAFLRVGGNRPIDADVRFICATHRDLEQAVADNEFRRDLYYRLRVVELKIPPLRDRGHDDLDRLIDHFLFELAQRHNRGGVTLSGEARAALHGHLWPGNVRELLHALESAVVLSPEDRIGPHSLSFGSPLLSQELVAEGGGIPEGAFWTDVRPLREVEHDYVRHVLEACGGNRSETARQLGIGRNTLLRKLAEKDDGEESSSS